MRFFPSSTTRKPVSQMWGQSDYCITLELFYICTYLLKILMRVHLEIQFFKTYTKWIEMTYNLYYEVCNVVEVIYLKYP